MKRLFTLFASLALLVSSLMLAPIADAGTQFGCVSGDTTKALLYENVIGDHSDGDDALWLCLSQPNLSNVDHELPGNCNQTPFGVGTWNDCVDSIRAYTPSQYAWCFYKGSNYTDIVLLHITSANSGVRFNIAPNQLSSGKLVLAAAAC